MRCSRADPRQRADMDWASRAIIQCREMLRLRIWCSPTPKELLSITEDSDRRLVRDGHDLLQMILSSLSRYQRTFAIEDLWNTRPCYTPKSEKALSDHVIRHLRLDLGGRAIVANREVEIATFGDGEGSEQVDILVEAFVQGRKEDVVRVVIEVKGCWNRDLLTSMEAQLSEQYLTNNAIHEGIYLVGWFLCSVWKEPDAGRAARARRWQLDFDAACRKFEQQATDLSRGGRRLSAFLVDARWPEQAITPPVTERG